MCAQAVDSQLGLLADVPFLKQLQVSRLHSLYPQEDHNEVGSRQSRDQVRIADNTGDRRLDQIFHVVQAMFDDGFGDFSEAGGIQGDVVIHQQHRLRPAPLQLLQVGDDTVDGMAAKV